MKRSIGWATSALAAAALALGVGACGGSDDDSNDSNQGGASGQAGASIPFKAICDPCGREETTLSGPLTKASTLGQGKLKAPGVPKAKGKVVGLNFNFTFTFTGGTVTGSGFMPLPDESNTIRGTWRATGGTCNLEGGGKLSGDTKPPRNEKDFEWRFTGELKPTAEEQPCA